MASVTGLGPKQSGGYFIPLGNVADKVLQYSGGTGAGGSFQTGNFTAAAWAAGGSAPSRYTSTISTIGAGGILRDGGKTVVSANRTFRKVQLITNAVSTGGVGGPAPGNTAAPADYLTGYVEVASGANGIPPGNNVGPGPAANPGTLPMLAYYPNLF